MFSLNQFKQKSPQQRFLFILGLFMILIFLTIGIILVFFSDMLNLDQDKFPTKYRIAFAIVLVVYSAIRFGRIMNQKDT
ncbi:hypothetical protein FA045_06810 [Pedobacter cryotolerans]|uniref:Uncharacterized protein n=1 Tax=Pedobacter cryotolerans TaxID=2571270 RepID=A0A4U1C725_9SPHI|nr:hypothetical protein FA045_06810 [Pedobacter cryotolerans]